MKIVVSGSGSMAVKHIENVLSIERDTEIISTSTRIRESSWGDRVRCVNSIDEAVELGADTMIVASRSDKHCGEIEAGNRYELDMYIEKPIVVDREQLERIKGLRWRVDTITQCGCNLRFLPSLRKMREVISSGALGKIGRASFTCGQWLPDWRPLGDHRKSYSAKSSQGGGVVLDLVHEIDAALWLLGDMEPIACMMSNISELEIESEAVALSMLRLKEGGLVSVCQDYIARKIVREYQIVGTLATLTWSANRQELVLSTSKHEDIVKCDCQAFDVRGTQREAMKSFLNSCITRESTGQDIMEGIRTAEIAIRLKELA